MKNDLHDILEYIDHATDSELSNLNRVINVIRSTGEAHDKFTAWLDTNQRYGLKADEVAAFLDSIGA